MRPFDPAPAARRHPAPAAPADLGTLHALLDESLAFGPEYGGQLANHLPMALASLYGMGATPAQMRRFFDHDAAQLVRLAPGARLAPALLDDWTALRGRFDAFERLRAHFAAAIVHDGQGGCLDAVLPELLPGAAAVAFHGLIRTAHAVEAGHDGELAAALAYWASRWTVLPAPDAPEAVFATPTQWLDALDDAARRLEPRWRPRGRLVTDRMDEAGATRAYRMLAGAVDGFEGTVHERVLALGEAAALRYAATRNFTVLHMATAARALRVLLRWITSVPRAVWHAVAAASLASTAGLAAPVQPPPLPEGSGAEDDWETVRRRACEQDDDHVVKLVHAMEDQRWQAPSAVWLAAARVAVRI